MASFSRWFRYAYHVIPLHILKLVGKEGGLLSKARHQEGAKVRRCTTAGVDEALGFSDYVHLYLPRRTTVSFSGLPILDTQLGESIVPPFPHAVVVVPTEALSDEECTVCNFNIAVSRPAYGEVRGGNHARGTDPTLVLQHWQGFRASNPSLDRMRRSFWHDGLAVPVLAGKQITDSPRSVGFGSDMPELLLRSRYNLRPSDTLYLFSDFDLASVRKLVDAPKHQVAEASPFEWYAAQDRVGAEMRRRIEDYFEEPDSSCPDDLNFDRLRPRSNSPLPEQVPQEVQEP
jgi:hypothetical protein